MHDLLTVVPPRSVHSVQIHVKHDMIMLVWLERFKDGFGYFNLTRTDLVLGFLGPANDAKAEACILIRTDAN